MKFISETWLTEGPIDFEYKKYILLAYLKDIKAEFTKGKLYPYFSDLILHYNNLIRLKEEKEIIIQGFSKEIKGIDLENLKITYKTILEDDELMKETKNIIEYALPLIHSKITDAKKIYEIVEENFEVEEIGISPLYKKDGYLLLHHDLTNHLNIYQYNVSNVYNQESYQVLQTHFIKQIKKTISKTFRDIKVELVRENKELPNPVTYLFQYQLNLPLNETILPVAKRILLNRISK